MLLKIGELAKRSGLTVRTLHHYDDIGLVSPSARTDAGYRLYQRTDIARLHQVQALRRFGMSLADIGTFLASPGASLNEVVAQQVAVLDKQMAQAALLRARLLHLQQQLGAGEQPDLAGWLTTLELMTMYDKYFSKEELAKLPLFAGDEQRIAEWNGIVARARAMIAAGTSPSEDKAQALAMAWMTMLERDTNGHAGLADRVNTMQAEEPALRQLNGIDGEVMAFVGEAFVQARLALFKKHLLPAELAHMDAHCRQRAQAWPPLIAAMRQALDAGLAPADPAVAPLARQWQDLSRDLGGDDPATHARIRVAYENEPGLMVGTWITDEMKPFIGAALAALAR
jgi:MerR family transcriptional regulator, thiopeptide resistance regulator